MENKNNNEWCKHFKNSFANCSLGDYTLNLGKFENGDQYRFEININLEGLYGHDDGWGEKKINNQRERVNKKREGIYHRHRHQNAQHLNQC